MDSVTRDINNMMSGEEQYEIAYEEFCEFVSDFIDVIVEAKKSIDKIASNYGYNNLTYDFTDKVKQLIYDEIG